MNCCGELDCNDFGRQHDGDFVLDIRIRDDFERAGPEADLGQHETWRGGVAATPDEDGADDVDGAQHQILVEEGGKGEAAGDGREERPRAGHHRVVGGRGRAVDVVVVVEEVGGRVAGAASAHTRVELALRRGAVRIVMIIALVRDSECVNAAAKR